MSLPQLKPPVPFDFKVPDAWPRWKRRFQQFRDASGLVDQSQSKQINTLLYCMGESAEDVLASMHPTEDEKGDYGVVMDKFDSFFKVRKNVIFERARFNNRVQLPEETAEQFITDLYHLVESCNYPEGFKEEAIRDRLVVGIRDRKLSESLQLDANLTLETAKKKIRQREAIVEQRRVLTSTTVPAEDASLDAVRSYHRGRGEPQLRRQAHCTHCGQEAHPRALCPAKETPCHYCRKRGHYSSQCFSRRSASERRRGVSEVTSDDLLATETSQGEHLDGAYLDAVVGADAHKTWMTTLSLNGHSIICKLDTGAEVTAISDDAYSLLGSPNLTTPEKTLYGPSQQQLEVMGQFPGSLTHNGLSVTQPVFVVKGLKTNLLGLPAIVALQLVTRMDSLDSSAEHQIIQIIHQFPTVFKGLGTLGGEYTIQLRSDAKPFSLYSARHIPLPLRSQVKTELSRMESLGVISRVDQPTTWCAGMVVVPKKNGSIRICVDFRPLNESVLQEVHPLPRVDDTLAQLSGAKVFSKLDANSGFWQIPLATESRLLTTFITPYGRFCFNKLPFGITSAPELFQKRMSCILAGLEGVVCLIDDVLIFAKDTKEHQTRLSATLTRIRDAGVTLNQEKCEFFRNEINFLGHVIDAAGIRADPAKTLAIANLRPPEDTSELRRFLGMVNQLSKFSKNLTELSHPLRVLLKKGQVWQWNSPQEEAFSRIKQEVLKATCLTPYSVEASTKVSADASSFGVGAVLLQQTEGEWRPVAFASRSMSETECRYAQIEKEALAITWACEKFSHYLLGLRFVIETDHKPLVPLLSTKILCNLPPWILRFRLRLGRFNYSIIHVPGKHMYTADTLSRAPQAITELEDIAGEADSFAEAYVNHLPASKHRLEEYSQAQVEDPICSQVIGYCYQGWPSKHRVNLALRPYWRVREELTVCQNLLLYGQRIVVPQKLRNQTLEKIHEGHQGVERCQLRAILSVWWPNMTSQLFNKIEQCPVCAKDRVPRREPLICSDLPLYHWQRVASDLFTLQGMEYLLVVDYFSRYPEVIKLSSTTSSAVIKALKSIFSRHGIPEELITDNGPQYSSHEFSQFAKTYAFTHTTSSPHYPESNGQSERTVKTIKKLLKGATDPYLALLIYRATPSFRVAYGKSY